MKPLRLLHEVDRWNYATERQLGLRTERSDGIQAQCVPLTLPVAVLNVGPGGFGIRTSEMMTMGMSRAFRFVVSDGEAVTISARVIYSVRASDLQGASLYYAGLQFVDDGPDRSRVHKLLLSSGMERSTPKHL